MPLINVKVGEGVFSPQQKKEIIEKVTDAVVSVESENIPWSAAWSLPIVALREVTWVIVEEVQGKDWLIGGEGLSTQEVIAEAEGAIVD